MKRDPSLHIKKSDLITLLNELDYSKRTTGHKLAGMIFEDGGKYQIRDRYLQLLSQNKNTTKKLKRSLDSDSGVPPRLVEQFNGILTSIRQEQNQHRKVKPILKDSKNYLLLKEVAKQAHEFAINFNIKPLTDGYREYINIGLGMMNKYSLNRFKYYDSKIYESFEDYLTVVTDSKREQTMEFYGLWKEAMLEYSGMDEFLDIDKDYSKFSYIVLGREEADKAKAEYAHWIVAQFEGLAFLEVIPELSQFCGENSIKRYEKYVRGFKKEEDKITDYYG